MNPIRFPAVLNMNGNILGEIPNQENLEKRVTAFVSYCNAKHIPVLDHTLLTALIGSGYAPIRLLSCDVIYLNPASIYEVQKLTDPGLHCCGAIALFIGKCPDERKEIEIAIGLMNKDDQLGIHKSKYDWDAFIGYMSRSMARITPVRAQLVDRVSPADAIAPSAGSNEPIVYGWMLKRNREMRRYTLSGEDLRAMIEQAYKTGYQHGTVARDLHDQEAAQIRLQQQMDEEYSKIMVELSRSQQ
jgi:hypothetical protein